MSRIDQLLKRLCPDGVEFKPLGEVGTFIRGNGLQKKDFTEEGFPCIHYGQIYTHYGTAATETKSFVAESLAARLRKAESGDLVIATTSENIEDVGKAVAWLGEGEVAFGGHTSIFTHTLDPLYASYFFQSESFQRQKKKYITGTKVKELPFAGIAKVKAPVPPLEIQQEIANTLAMMESLEAGLKAELNAELEARRRQHAYYRDALLTLPEQGQTRWVTLGEVGEFIRGRRFTKNDYTESGMGCIHYGQIYTDYGTAANRTITFLDPGLRDSLRLARKNDLVIAATGENIEDVCKAVAWLGEEEVAIHDDCYIFRHTLDPKFASYLFQSSSFREQKARYANESKVVRISGANMAKIKVQIPSLEEQKRVVAVLDNFQSLINHLSTDLPAEIATRQQQYAHFRDRLLTFEEKKAA